MLLSTFRILIVPDFGVSAEAEDMVVLKKAIDSQPYCTAKIVDLPKIVTEEHPDQTLDIPKLIRLCARKLKGLASDDSIEWDKEYSDMWDEDDFFRRIDIGSLSDLEEEGGTPAEKPEDVPTKEPEDTPIEKPIGMRKLKITKSVTKRGHKPTALEVFGRSAMLAGGVERIPILFINPKYDTEWPWKNQFYIDRKEAEKFYDSFKEKAELDDPQRQLAAAFDDYGAPRWKQPKRIALFTDTDFAEMKEFGRRYPHLAMSDPDLRDTSALAETVREFCRGHIESPRFDIDRTLLIPERKSMEEALTVTLPHPLELRDGRKLLAVELEAPSQYRETGTVVHVEGSSRTQPLDSIHDRRDLGALRDALRDAVKMMPQRKRILIVGDCFASSPSTVATQLSEVLQAYGHYVPVMPQGKGLKDSRDSLEWRCRRKHFDLVVTLESGCLLAGRITDNPRIFVNPNWNVWEYMKGLGCERKEWEMARKMSQKGYIRKDNRALEWVTTDTDIPALARMINSVLQTDIEN